MKKIIVLMSILALFFSCKETVIDGFDSESVKEKIISTLKNSEWVSYSPEAYYSKIVFYKDVLHLTHNNETKAVGYDVTNVTGTMEELPSEIQLRLKSGLVLDELYLNSSGFTSLNSSTRVDVNSNRIWAIYTRLR